MCRRGTVLATFGPDVPPSSQIVQLWIEISPGAFSVKRKYRQPFLVGGFTDADESISLWKDMTQRCSIVTAVPSAVTLPLTTRSVCTGCDRSIATLQLPAGN